MWKKLKNNKSLIIDWAWQIFFMSVVIMVMFSCKMACDPSLICSQPIDYFSGIENLTINMSEIGFENLTIK
jgi:hypothetical protein